MDISSIIAKLHPFERTILPYLRNTFDLPSIIQKSKLQETEAMRALQWLENKAAVKIHTATQKLVLLDANGREYQKHGLPEQRFLKVLEGEFKGLNVIIKKAKISREEAEACLGLLRRKNAIELKKEEGLLVKITDIGRKFLQDGFPEEHFLQQHFPLEWDSADKAIMAELQKRKEFLTIQEKKVVTVELTALGKELASSNLAGKVINRLTKAMLQQEAWKDIVFRAYDIEVNVPQRWGGRKHFVEQAIEYAKKVWMDMGFQEMTGNMVQTSFWNFDALFTAQDHPVREMQDTFFLAQPEKGNLPDRKLVEKVKKMHENGAGTGSTGWGNAWSEDEARRNVLRTHTTVLTAKTLASLQEKDLPAKFFALGKNFRNEALDWKHLFEFNQTEGIVVDEKANFCHLLGYLRQFFRKMGFPQARFRPAYFPYTEPSVEIDVFHVEKKEWVEFGGAGMLRPEVVVPLFGRDVPVLAWGPGFDRTIIEYWDIKDIRDLYKNDLQQLREQKVWLK